MTKPSIAQQTLNWTKKNVWVAILAVVLAALGIVATVRQNTKPTGDSISQTATSTSGKATNNLANNQHSGQGVQQNATTQGAGDATNNAANGPGSSVNSNNTAVNAPQFGSLPPGEVVDSDEMTVTKQSVRIIRHYAIAPHASQGSTPPKFATQIRFYFGLGASDLKQGKVAAAVQDNTQVIKLNPLDAGAFNNRAIAKLASGDYPGAIKDLNVATRLDPLNASYHANLAKALSRYAVGKKNVNDFVADSIHQDYLALNSPSNPPHIVSDLWADIAAGYLQVGQSSLASEAITKALDNDPASSQAHAVNASLLALLGKTSDALVERNLASRLDPTNPVPYWDLAEIYAFTTHDRNMAYVNLTKALALDPSLRANFNNPNAPWKTLCNEQRFKVLILGAGH